MNRFLQSAVAMTLVLLFPERTSNPVAPERAQQQPSRPTLVVFVTIDQMRGDYLSRFAGQFTGGLRRLGVAGAHFTQAYHDHAITETAPGHAALLSGRLPVHTGIAANSDGVGDPANPVLGSADLGASPRRFKGTTLLDWMRASDRNTRFLSVSRKDRSAILPIGTSKGDVYWYSSEGQFTTSRYYTSSLPTWVNEFNAKGYPAKYRGWKWTPLLSLTEYPEPDSVPSESFGRNYVFPHVIPDDPDEAAQSLGNFPVMDELTLQFALAGVRQLQLGANNTRTDLLNISLSTTDAIGHRYGPDSRELHDQLLRVDRYLGAFMDSLFAIRDSTRVILALSSDHGMSPLPGELSVATPNPGARFVDIRPVWRSFITRLAIAGIDTMQVDFVDGGLLVGDTTSFVKAKVNVDSVARVLVKELRAVPGVHRADLLRDLVTADTVVDVVARRWLHMFAPGGVVRTVTTFDQYNYWAGMRNATHGTLWNQDAWVPVVFWGSAFKAGKYTATVRAVDMAPTLAQVLKVRPMEKVDGVVLKDAIR